MAKENNLLDIKITKDYAERARSERAGIAGWLKHSSQRRRLQKIIKHKAIKTIYNLM